MVLPPNLRPQLADPEIPWHISDTLFERLSQMPSENYQKCEVIPQDIEWDFVHRFFNAQRPTNLAIKRIYCIHNPIQTRLFTEGIRLMHREAKNPKFAPKWKQQKNAKQRLEIMDRWTKVSAAYVPFKAPLDEERKEECQNVYILPLWHGSDQAKCDSICKSGFAVFGQGSLNKTDDGFFGSGIYFTNSARYAADIYAKGHLFLAWVTMREPYPVTGDKNFPRPSRDMRSLSGKGNRDNYNAHFIPVVSIKPKDKKCEVYHPYPPGKTPVWDEFVVFDKSQTLPRFWIELAVDLPASVHISPSVQLFQKLIQDLLENGDLQSNQDLKELLTQKGRFLIQFYTGSEPLPLREEKFYETALNLLDSGKKVNAAAVQKLFELNAVIPTPFKKTRKLINLKELHPHYIPRIKLLTAIEKAILCKSSGKYVLYGPGGVGKTELAVIFANKHLDKFAFVWSISCSTEQEMEMCYRDLGVALKASIDQKDSKEEIVRKVHQQLEQFSGKPWLLIFDNLNMSFTFPSRGGICLITAYSKKPEIEGLEVGFLTQAEALELLQKVTKQNSSHFPALIEQIGCYTLQVSQVAADLAQIPTDVQQYISFLQSETPLLLKPSVRYPKTLDIALSLSIESLIPAALEWIQICAWLNPAHIPLSYLDAYLTKSYSSANLRLRKMHEITANLVDHAFISFKKDTNSMSLRLELKKQIAHIYSPAIEKAVDLLLLIRKNLDFENTQNWNAAIEQASEWRAHVLELVSKKEWEKIAAKDRGDILASLGELEYQEAHFLKAEEYFTQALEIRKACAGAESIEVASSLFDISKCYCSQGKYDRALQSYEEVLKIREERLGKEHPDVAMTHNAIATCYYSQGKYDLAFQSYGAALKIFKAIFGNEHSSVAKCYSGIGNCYYRRKQYNLALQYYKVALKICKKVFGENHPDVADSHHNIGVCYYFLGKYTHALRAHDEALRIREDVFGKEHAVAADSLHNIGDCYYARRKYHLSLYFYEEALKIRKKVFGSEHLVVAETLNTISYSYSSQGKSVIALRTQLEALRMRIKILSEKQ